MTSPCATPVVGMPPPTNFQTFYLGKPGAMTKLRVPDARFTAPLSRGEVSHQLPSGGVTVTRRPAVKRSWVLPYSGMLVDEADALVSYYSGARGLGPFCLVDPSWRNQLGLSASTMDAARGANTVWNPATGDAQAFVDATFAPALPGSAVLRWPTPVLNHYLFEGTQPGGILTPNTTKAAPYLNDLAAVVSLYARTVTGATNVALLGLGVAATGWDTVSSVSSGTKPLSTAWSRLTAVVPLAQWAATMPYLCVALKALSAGGPDILVSNADIQLGVVAPYPWVTGLGVARVSLTAGMPSSSTTNWRRDTGLVASEN